jgi:hypothetical protein
LLTAWTILHRTKIALTNWFWAAYLMTTEERGVSALLVQRQLGLSCYETAWMMLHKLRRAMAMVNVGREPLHGEVEVDETWVGGEQVGLRGSRQLRGRRAALVLSQPDKQKPSKELAAPLHQRLSDLIETRGPETAEEPTHY